ncbi:MAG TPA: branched-chain amino acid ABC transporter substrate-binding protein [Actinopolymorphaceae bacterium]
MDKARLVRIVALAALVSLGVASCAQQGNQATRNDNGTDSGNDTVVVEPDPAPEVPADAALPAGDGKAQCAKGTSIAYIGTIAGAAAALGQNILWGVRLAVKEHNEANPGCQVTLKEFDSEGSPDKAPAVVTQAINDPSILGVVGLPFSGESKAVGKAFHDAGLAQITPAATNPNLSKNGWKTFFRGLGNDSDQAPAVASFISDTLKAESVCVVRDDSEYGIGLAELTTEALGDKVVCEPEIKTGQKEFSAVVGEITSADPDAVFFSGYYPEGAPFAQQLRDAGYEGALVAPDGVRDAEYVKNAGEAAEGTYLSCPCLPSAGFEEFSKAYQELSDREPSTYSPEGYDATTILLKAIDAGNDDRASVLEFVRNYDGQGLTKHFKWDANGELEETPVWMYIVKNGEIVHLKDMGSGT